MNAEQLAFLPSLFATKPRRARDPKVLSYGGGLDSWSMLLDAEARDELPDVCAFVDVGDRDDAESIGEWESTYRHIEEVVIPWCAARGVQWVEISARTGYAIRPQNQNARSLFDWLWTMGQIPVSGPNRICTRIAKVERFEAWLDATYPGESVEVWIGFDAAETDRVEKDPNAGKVRSIPKKAARDVPKWWGWTVGLAFALTHARRVNRFPLVERGLCRCRCLKLATASGYPVPRKSACVYCLTGDTDVVTRDGIKPIRDLVGHADLLVPQMGTHGGLGHRGSFKTAEVRSFGVQTIWEITLRRMKSVRVVRATAEHRWFVTAGKQWEEMSAFERTTAQLKIDDRLRTLRATTPASENLMPVAVAQGFVFGDGSHPLGDDERPASVTFYGAKAVLIPFFVPSTVHEHMINGALQKHVYGLPRSWKQTPSIRESRSFLLSWLAGYFAADGSVTKAGQAVLDSASLSALSFARDVAAVCGVGYTKIQSRLRKGFGAEPSPLYRIGFRLADVPSWFFIRPEHKSRVDALDRATHDAPWIVEKVVQTEMGQEVFCAIVPEAGAFGLSEDLMTGNCPYGSRGDWKALAAQAPTVFDRVVELEHRKAPTKKNKRKLSIMAYDSKKQSGTPLRVYVSRPYKAKVVPCTVCGAARRATKATGCDYLPTEAASA